MVPSATARHVGRPRNPALDAAILRATLDVLHEHGYAGFSLEAVATHAGTTKPSIARRWRGRQELIMAALATVIERQPVPDTGCTRCDLTDGLELLADTLLRRMPTGVLAPLIADCAPEPDLHRHLTDKVVRPAQEALASTVRQALERGHLRPDTDPALVVDVLAAVVFHSSLFADTEFDVRRAAEVVDLTLRGIAVDFQHLVRLSQQHDGDHRHGT
jgi:AcrR family transcriptional regulator